MSFRPAALLAAAMMLASGPALADRDPTPEERERIEAALRAEGFVRWDDIELEDDGPAPHWEVDDAVGADGREYDLKLDVDTLAIIERDPD